MLSFIGYSNEVTVMLHIDVDRIIKNYKKLVVSEIKSFEKDDCAVKKNTFLTEKCRIIRFYLLIIKLKNSPIYPKAGNIQN